MDAGLRLSQKQGVSQYMVRSAEILQMGTAQLDVYLSRLALENPVIDLPEDPRQTSESESMYSARIRQEWTEQNDPDNRSLYKKERDSAGPAGYASDTGAAQSLSEHIFLQLILKKYTPAEREAIEFLVYSLDSRGYLSITAAELSEYLGIPAGTAKRLIRDLQSLEPAGIGARDLRECLKLQLDRLEDVPEAAYRIVSDHLEDLAKNHISKIAKCLNIMEEAAGDACSIIRSLNPKPAGAFGTEKIHYIEPDVFVVKTQGGFEAMIRESEYSDFKLNPVYAAMRDETNDPEVRAYLDEKIAQAEWVRDCIKRRGSMLNDVLSVIVSRQEKFFLKGPAFRVPLDLKTIAEITGHSESAVSRAMKDKYLQCSWGVVPLRYFLARKTSAAAGQEYKTQDQVCALIKQLIDEENKSVPLSDQKISEKLADFGVAISRRTVNKYRSEMGISDRSGRKSNKN